MKNPASKATIAIKADGVASPTSQAALTPLVDELMDLYISWREECDAVAASYENWSAAERRDNQLGFSAYLAAVDREEHAAATYRGLVERCGGPWRQQCARPPVDSREAIGFGERHPVEPPPYCSKAWSTQLVEQRPRQL